MRLCPEIEEAGAADIGGGMEIDMRRLYIYFILCSFMVAATGCVKVVKMGEEDALTGKVAFEESLDVPGFWDTQAVPEVKEQAVALADFLKRSEGDLKKLAGEYGRFTMGDSGELNYAVYGTGTVEEVHDEVKAGYLEVKLDGYDGQERICIQIGPVFKKTTVRDYLSFLDVNHYADQIEFARVSKEINRYILEHVVQPVDIEHLRGKKIGYYGCFTYEKDDTLLITPVLLEEE